MNKYLTTDEMKRMREHLNALTEMVEMLERPENCESLSVAQSGTDAIVEYAKYLYDLALSVSADVTSRSLREIR